MQNACFENVLMKTYMKQKIFDEIENVLKSHVLSWSKKKTFIKQNLILFSLWFHKFKSYHDGIMIKISSKKTFDHRIWLYFSSRYAKFDFFEYFVKTDQQHKRCSIICKSEYFYFVEFVEKKISKMRLRCWKPSGENENF